MIRSMLRGAGLRLGLVAWAAGSVSAQSPAARVDAIAAPYTGDRPGLGVLVVRHDSVLFERGYGLANLERAEPITPDTRFLLGSVSKQFTALAVMILADRGRLRYDAPIATYLPEFSGRAGRITVEELLHHQGGLPEYEQLFVDRGLVDRDWPRSVTTPPSRFEPTAPDALDLLARADSLEFAPGSRFEYSNSGYMVLAQIVARVSGQRFADFLRENVFAPLGMRETVLYDERRPAELPPKPGGDPYEIVCTTYSGFMVRERRDGPSSQDAAIVRGSRPVCDARKVPGEIVLKTSDKYLIGRKGPFLIFSEMDPHGAVPFVIVDAGSGRIIFKDATVGNPDFRSAALEKGVLRLRYARGFNAPCSILQDAKGCWAKLVAAGMIPAAMAREVPSPRICDAAYKAMSGAPADAPSIVSYDVDMRVTAKGTTQFLSRGAVHCGIVP